MGRYIDWEHVSGRYPTVAGNWDGERVNSHFLGPAEDELDARLSARFTTPFSTAPGIVKDLCVDLTYCKMRHFSKEVQPIAERVESRIQEIIAGTLMLGDEQATGNSAWISSSYHTAFGVDDAVNWQVDADEEEQQRADRL